MCFAMSYMKTGFATCGRDVYIRGTITLPLLAAVAAAAAAAATAPAATTNNTNTYHQGDHCIFRKEIIVGIRHCRN